MARPYYITLLELEDFIKEFLTQSFSVNNGLTEVNLSEVQSSVFVFNLEGVIVDDSFANKDSFKIIFDTVTTYQVFHTRAGVYHNRFRGNGDIAVDFIIAGVITIPSGTFAGTITIDDTLVFDLKRAVSNDSLTQIIVDSELEVDSFAMGTREIYYKDEVQALFGTTPSLVPGDIKIATKKWSLAFLLERKLLPFKVEDVGEGYTHRLKNSARKNIWQVIKRRLNGRPSAGARYDSDDSSNLLSLTDISKGNCDLRNDPSIADDACCD